MVASPQSPLPFTLTTYLSVGLGFHWSLALAARRLLPLSPCGLDLVIAFGVDLLLAAFQHRFRCDITDRAVQSLLVINLNVLRDQTDGIIQGQGHAWPDTLAFDRAVPAFHFAVRLRIVRRRAHVGHPRDADEFLEVLRDELWAVVGNNPRTSCRELLLGPLQQDFDIRLAHGFPQAPIHDVAAGSVQNRAQVVERAMNVDMRDVDMPVFMRPQRLLEARSFLRWMSREVAEPAGIAQYAENTRRADGDHIRIDHHVG